MAPSHLHAYPKVFNRNGHLKALPIRKPVTFHFTGLCLIGLAFFAGFQIYFDFMHRKFTNAEFFKSDRTELLMRKRAFDTLILGNKITTNHENVQLRSIF